MCQDCIDNQDSLLAHIAMLDSLSLPKYKDSNSLFDAQDVRSTAFIEILRDRRRRLTTAQRRHWPTIKTTGKLWIYPFAIEKQYQAWITRKMQEYSDIALPRIQANMSRWVEEYAQANTVADAITKDTYDDEVNALINALRDKQNEMFVLGQETINAEIAGFAGQVSEQNQKEFEKFQKVAIGTTFQPQEPWIRGTVSTWVTNNRTLLRGLSDEFIKKLEFNVSSGFQDGLASSEIIKNIFKMNENMTLTRARLLGRDQIGKLNGIYSKNRAQQAGLTMYVWLTANDERVRATHITMNNTVNKWSNPTVYSKDGGKTFIPRNGKMQNATPGSQIQCRCTQKPFFDELIGKLDKEVEEDQNES